MIRFFRHIRKTLMEQNKVRTYLLYAVGEIALVMIGILLALQVNNWNEFRKEKSLEIRALTEISTDMQEDILSLEGDAFLNKRYLTSSTIIRKALESDQQYQDSLALHFGRMNFNTTYTLKISGYDNLKNLGFQIVSNDTLRKLITDLYESSYSFHKKGEKTADQSTYEYFSPRYLSYFKRIHSEPGALSARRYYTPSDFNTMKNNSEFNLLLDYIDSIREDNLFNIEVTLTEIRNTKTMLDEYLREIN